MISFKEYLTEARMAPLYHGTGFRALHHILVDKEGITPSTAHAPEDFLLKRGDRGTVVNKSLWSGGEYITVQGVSASRDLEFARHYRNATNSAVIVLDQAALAQRYQIRPLQFWRGAKVARFTYSQTKRPGVGTERINEYEEFIVTRKEIPVKYITGIIIPKDKVDEAVVKRIRDIYGSSFIKTF